MNRIIAYAIGVLLLACGSASPGDGQMADRGRSTGKTLFDQNCALCHGRDGKLGINGAKDLTVSTLTREEMVQVVKMGRGAMMPYKDVLGAKEIDAVVDHVRTLGKQE